MERVSTGWKSITISVPVDESCGVPVVAGDMEFFQPILARILDGGTYKRFGKLCGGEMRREGEDLAEAEVLREGNLEVIFLAFWGFFGHFLVFNVDTFIGSQRIVCHLSCASRAKIK